MAITREDWDQYMGAPNEFFAAPGDRILHEDLPEQKEEFWNDFLQGRNGSGFAKIDCEENRELLLQKYREAHGFAALEVRSALNELWRKYAITRSAFDHGFINPHEDEMVEAMREGERPRDVTGRLMSPKAIQWQQWEVWVNDPETSMRAILEKRRTDPAFAEFYAWCSQNERTATPVGDSVENVNVRSATTKKAVSPELLQFAAEYRKLSSDECRRLMNAASNPDGYQKWNQQFEASAAAGLI